MPSVPIKGSALQQQSHLQRSAGQLCASDWTQIPLPVPAWAQIHGSCLLAKSYLQMLPVAGKLR